MRIRSAQFWSVILPAVLLLTSSSIFAQSKSNAKNANRPNILVILADDLADWHLGCYGNREIRTPNMDRLAAEGIRMSKDRNLPGRSYWPLLAGKKMKWENVIYTNLHYVDAVRDRRYKLVWRHGGRGPNELFDLKTDSREKQNRIDDSKLAGVKQRLRERLEQWSEKYK